MTSGYTGADLNALVTQARMNVIEKALEATDLVSEFHFFVISIKKFSNFYTIFQDNRKEYKDKKITQDDLVESAKSIRPSLLTMEKEKYTRM